VFDTEDHLARDPLIVRSPTTSMFPPDRRLHALPARNAAREYAPIEEVARLEMRVPVGHTRVDARRVVVTATVAFENPRPALHRA
jgi:hypothetical protein